MAQSEQIAQLATALSKAQAMMAGAKKDALNTHLKSKYADLASTWEACRDALTRHELAVLQSPRSEVTSEGLAVIVDTVLMHASGEWVSGSLLVPVTKPDAQGVGSAITYARRYALSAFAGIAPEDDDGAAASAPRSALPAKPKGYDDAMADLDAVAADGIEALQQAWMALSKPMRDYALAFDPAAHAARKQKAASK